MSNTMIDLETCSLANNPIILSIGAVKFDKHGELDTFYEKISVSSCKAIGLHECPATMAWWEKQDPATRAEAFGGTKSLDLILAKFQAWLGDGAVIYGNGATADNIWLANAYKALGIEVPWKYYNDRCYRTLMSIFPPKKRTKPKVAHNALSDARAQVKNLRASMQQYGYDLD